MPGLLLYSRLVGANTRREVDKTGSGLSSATGLYTRGRGSRGVSLLKHMRFGGGVRKLKIATGAAFRFRLLGWPSQTPHPKSRRGKHTSALGEWNTKPEAGRRFQKQNGHLDPEVA